MTADHDREPDIVRIILTACQAEGLSPDAAALIERTICQDYGGQRVYIPKRRKRLNEEARQQVYAEGLTTKPTREITEAHGISRATLYRLMKCIK